MISQLYMVEETGGPGKHYHLTSSQWQLSHLPWLIYTEDSEANKEKIG